MNRFHRAAILFISIALSSCAEKKMETTSGVIKNPDFYNKDLQRIPPAAPAPAASPIGGPIPEILLPMRDYAFPDQEWRHKYGGTSIVVFTRRPSPSERNLYNSVCEAWKSAFILSPASPGKPQTQLQKNSIMGLFWPLDVYPQEASQLDDCNYLVNHYNIEVGQRIAYETRAKENGTKRARGPLLAAWRTAAPDVKIYMDLEKIRRPETIMAAFEAWRDHIRTEPKNWENGLSLESFRLVLSDFLDKYSGVLLCVFSSTDASKCIKSSDA